MVKVISLPAKEMFSRDCEPEGNPSEVSALKLRHPTAYPAWQGKQPFANYDTPTRGEGMYFVKIT